MLPILALAVTLPLFVACTPSPLNIVLLNNGTIKTHMETVKLQGITFERRAINLTAPASVSFEVQGVLDINLYHLAWFVNGNDISAHVKRYKEVPTSPREHAYSTEGKYSDSSSIVTLHLLDRRLVPGVYALHVSPSKESMAAGIASGYILAPPILPLFSKVRKVLDGDPLTLFCQVTGYPLPDQVTWKFSHIKPESMEDSATLTDASENLKPLDSTSSSYNFSTNVVVNDQLVFQKLPREFSGLYGCYVTGPDGTEDKTLILVNIKDRWAALWPFIGIVIEVILLVSVILLYERHQMRSRAAKNEPLPTADPMSPSTIPQAAQPNSVPPSTELQGHDKPVTEDTGEDKPDDLRQRGAPQC